MKETVRNSNRSTIQIFTTKHVSAPAQCQRVHVQPQHQRACAHGTRTPAGGAPRGPGRPWRVAAAPELPMPWARAVLWARRRGSSMCPDRLILYAKCAFRIWCALTCAFRICPTENHAGIPPGCALTCALKNRAYGASVPAGGVCLQGQNDGIAATLTTLSSHD